jgi:23S rRNA pseudouridine1911/1915/1917 synthase
MITLASSGKQERRRAEVGAADAGARLDKFLAQTVEGLTRMRIKALIEEGAVARAGAVVTDPAAKVRSGDVFDILVPPAEPSETRPEAIPLDILYEDEALIVVNKPAGMVVHPAAGHGGGTLVNALLAHCGASLSGIGGVARPGIVHRIDKDTSGVLVAAKSDAAHQSLAESFAAHAIERVYDAVATGAPRPGKGVIDAPVARGRNDRTRMTVVDEDPEDESEPKGARHAVTHYKVVEAFGRARAKLKGDALACRLECRLETGRTHQIRVHLAHIGHPLVGDHVYGRTAGLPGLRSGDAAADAAIAVIKDFKRQALHARILGFVHPLSGDTLRFEAPPPADFLALVAVLRDL